MKRVSVVGNTGSGKSTFARKLAAGLDMPYVELDAIYHQADWQPLDDDVFMARVADITDGDRWVIDGNYSLVVNNGPVWQRADTVVWIDPPRHRVMRQVFGRTLIRGIRGTELWNGNREDWRSLLKTSPEANMVLWAWTRHGTYQQRYSDAMNDPAYDHLDFIRL